MKKTKGKSPSRRMHPVKLIVTDILLVGVILVVFAMFHHVIPAIRAELRNRERQAAAATETTVPETTVPATTVPEATVPGTTVPETTAPDLRTEWQKKFAEHFTPEIVTTDHSYQSPNVSVSIEKVETGEGSGKITYFVADIYIASMENFVTATAHNETVYFDTQDVLEMDAMADALLSISGDFLTYQKSGLLLRNGEVYVSDNNFYSICVLNRDGTMETYDGGEYTVDEILGKDPLQVWSFGPELLDENGKALGEYQVSEAVAFPNPRSAIGYYEPGHYCFVVVDGRQAGYSAGMTIPELAQVFEGLGCTSAYNLDGGGSAVMVFDDRRYSQPSNGGNRDLGDILVIREADPKEVQP